jgi:flagellar motility protein MotE (MotC chaperone)
VKALFNVLVMMLAVNFLAAAGAVGWLWKSGHLDRQRAQSIKEVLFPPPAQPAASSTTRPTTAPDAGTAAMLRLDDLLAGQRAARTAGEQVEVVQRAFDSRLAQLDERQRQVEDLVQVARVAQARVERERAALEADRQQLEAKRQEAERLTADKGFQDTLDLYNAMPGKQVKAQFLRMDDATVARYLQAMEPRTASQVMREFKTPDETQRLHQVLERIRASTPATQASKE